MALVRDATKCSNRLKIVILQTTGREGVCVCVCEQVCARDLVAFNPYRECTSIGSVTNSTIFKYTWTLVKQHIISNEIKEAHSNGFRLHLQYFFFLYVSIPIAIAFSNAAAATAATVFFLHRIFFPIYIINYVFVCVSIHRQRLHSC